MNKQAKIYVAGATGLVGSAIVRRLQEMGFHNLLTPAHAELDLTNQNATEQFFAIQKPEFVFLAAAKVGGIYANQIYPADFININLAIEQNVINSAFRHKVKRLLFLGSSCIYPCNCTGTIKEEDLLTGPLEITNRAYAIAKIAGIEQCFAYNKQHGTKYLAVMPSNLYGPGDNYDLNNSHVLPALLRKFHEAKLNNSNEVEVWGSGSPKREFLYVDDLASACVFLLQLQDTDFTRLISSASQPPIINIGCGKDISIKELAELIKSIVGFPGKITWNKNKPDGTLRKLLDITNITSLNWKAKVSLREGITKTYLQYR